MKQEKGINLFDICTLIKAEIKQSANSFVSIGYWLKEIKRRKLYQETGYKDIWEFATAQFGFSQSTASRFMNINDRFSIDGNSTELESRYKEFSSSQLSEMLTLSDSQIEQVSVETTVKEIRAMKPKRKEKAEQVKVEKAEHKKQQSVATSQQPDDTKAKQEKRRYENPPPSLPDGWYRKVPLGKKDCEGKEIKEGDILESQIDKPAGIFYVVWHPMGVGFKAVLPKHVQPDGTAEDNITYISSNLWDETRIIGSIYDSGEIQE